MYSEWLLGLHRRPKAGQNCTMYLSDMGCHIDSLKELVRKVSHALCELGLYTLKLSLRDHFVENMDRFGTLQLPGSSATKWYNVHIKNTNRSTQ